VSKSEKKEEKNEKKLARYLSLLIENLAANFQFFSKSDHSLFSDLGASYPSLDRSVQSRQGAVPDLGGTLLGLKRGELKGFGGEDGQLLAEVKCLNGCMSRYMRVHDQEDTRKSNLRDWARKSKYNQPVEQKAREVQWEYVKKMRDGDKLYNGGGTLLETHLASFGNVLPCVFGTFGEFNIDCENFVKVLSRKIAVAEFATGTSGFLRLEDCFAANVTRNLKDLGLLTMLTSAQEVLRRLKYLGADVLSADRKKNEVKRFLKHRTKRTEIVRSHNIYPHGVGFLRVHGITAHG